MPLTILDLPLFTFAQRASKDAILGNLVRYGRSTTIQGHRVDVPIEISYAISY